jgi:hypothetical protein
VLLDPPNPSYLVSCDSLARKLHYLQYALRRAERLGPRITFAYVREHLFKYLARSLNLKSTRTERGIAQQMIEAAAFEYRPRRHDGKVLLLLASERAPHVNFLPGWEAVIPANLHTQYVDAHHRELPEHRTPGGVADAIIRQLSLAGEESQLNGPGSFSIREVEQTEDAELRTN